MRRKSFGKYLPLFDHLFSPLFHFPYVSLATLSKFSKNAALLVKMIVHTAKETDARRLMPAASCKRNGGGIEPPTASAKKNGVHSGTACCLAIRSTSGRLQDKNHIRICRIQLTVNRLRT